MGVIESIVAYICLNYLYSSELSKTRLTKLVYLADWFSSLADGRQITNIKWVFNHYGPYVDDVMNIIENNRNFEVEYSLNTYGTERTTISYHGLEEDIILTDRQREILDVVMKKTSNMYFNDFINYVYSTYPIVSSDRYSYSELVKLARDYRENNN